MSINRSNNYCVERYTTVIDDADELLYGCKWSECGATILPDLSNDVTALKIYCTTHEQKKLVCIWIKETTSNYQ